MYNLYKNILQDWVGSDADGELDLSVGEVYLRLVDQVQALHRQ